MPIVTSRSQLHDEYNFIVHKSNTYSTSCNYKPINITIQIFINNDKFRYEMVENKIKWGV